MTQPEEPLSKSERKREAERLQHIGRRLAELTTDTLDNMNLPDDLRRAVADYQRFPSHGAKRRQLQFIGKLMRKVDTDAIEAQLATLDGESAQARYLFNQLEQWRERLIEDPATVTDFIAEYPGVDRQQLRQLISKIKKSTDPQQQKTIARQLFRLLREAAGESDG